jgi:acyl dehydratase
MKDENKQVSFTVLLTEDLHNEFASMSGSYAPLHFDDEFAREAGYEKRVSFGLLSLVLAAKFEELFPGVYMIGYEWNAKFKRPVYIGDELTFGGGLGTLRKSTRTTELIVSVINQRKEEVALLNIKVKMIK